jgi:hypothetical protein
LAIPEISYDSVFSEPVGELVIRDLPLKLIVVSLLRNIENHTAMYLRRLCKSWASHIGIEIRIAHYPPYTSKYNPIEHRLFPHLSRACRGVIFENVATVSNFMATATTLKGLRVFPTILDRTYKTGQKVAEGFKETMEIFFDDFLPQWNYTAKPQPS